MNVTILGSGSRGNAVVLEADGARVLVDAGFNAKTLATRMAAADIAPESISAVVLTHEHTDHVTGACTAARKWGWSIYATAGTIAGTPGLPALRPHAIDKAMRLRTLLNVSNSMGPLVTTRFTDRDWTELARDNPGVDAAFVKESARQVAGLNAVARRLLALLSDPENAAAMSLVAHRADSEVDTASRTNKENSSTPVADGAVAAAAEESAEPAVEVSAAETKGVSNCSYCAIGHDSNKDKIWSLSDMDADHVSAWSKGGSTEKENCEMLCKPHNRAKGNR